MLRAAPQLCPFCEIRTVFPGRASSATALQWHQTRFASQFQGRPRPSRMELSPKVAQSRSKPAPRRTDGPFAGLNRTKVPGALLQAQQLRDSRPRNSRSRDSGPRDSWARDSGPRDNRPTREYGARDNAPSREYGSRNSAPSREYDARDSRPPRDFGARDSSRPPRDFGARDSSRPPRDFGARDSSRPPRDFGARDSSRPPRDFGARDSSRPPRDFGASDSSRPPRDFGARDSSRPPRDFARDSSRPPRDFGARDSSRPPRDFGASDSSRPPRDFARDSSRPPRDFARDSSRPPRDFGAGDSRPTRDFDARDSRPSREYGPMGARRSTNPKDRASKEDPRWYKALKERRALSEVPYERRADVKKRIAEFDDFQQFPLLPVIQNSIVTQVLAGLEDIAPTPAQRVAIPALLGMDRSGRSRGAVTTSEEMQQFLVAAETGSGKTLAYLVPVLDAIKRAEEQDKEAEEREKAAAEAKKENMFELAPPPLSGEEDSDVGRPRAIVLVPSAELVAQVGAVAKAFSHTVKFKAALISSAFSGNVIRNRLFSPSGVDLVVATPHLLSSIAESDPNVLSRVSHLVIDEADSLLDRSFSPLTTEIIDKASPSLKQLVFCSATIPRSMDGYLRKRFPDIKRLVTPNLHAIPRRVQLGVVQCDQPPYKGNKDLACADTIWSIGRAAAEHFEDGKEVVSTKRVIVFVNEREKAVELAQYLVSKGIDAMALNRDTATERQSSLLASFTGAAADEDDTKAEQPAPVRKDGRSLPGTKVLVATDLGSRGIDTVSVKHVILYDVPHSTVDFIHRLGRTGRMGRRGRGIVLLGKGDRADVVKDVREGMYRGQALI